MRSAQIHHYLNDWNGDDGAREHDVCGYEHHHVRVYEREHERVSEKGVEKLPRL